MSESSSSRPAEFDGFAGDYDAALNEGLSVSGEDKNYFARGRLRWLAGRLAKMRQSPTTAMDFGCGTGSATPFFFECFRQLQTLIGTDVSAESLQVARQTYTDTRVSFATMDEHAPAGSLELAYCNGVFHHIPPDQRPVAVKYIYESLRPGGLFALFENNPWNPATRYVMSRIPFDRDAITLSPPEARSMVRDAGFKVLRSDFLFYFPRALRLLRPVEPALVKLPLGTQYLILAQK